MSGRAEQLFHQLTSAHAILALIGQSEDAHFDCKEWPAKDEDAQKVFAKAACGLANAEGGVLVVGMKAKAISKDEPDLVDSAAPVADTGAEKSRILDLVGQLVEPGIEGIQAAEVNEPSGSKSGAAMVDGWSRNPEVAPNLSCGWRLQFLRSLLGVAQPVSDGILSCCWDRVN